MQNNFSEVPSYDTIIIGVGPAGLTAALYTARAGLKTLAFGILRNSNAHKASVFENYFGFENQISGPQLMEAGKKQAVRHGASFLEREIIDVIRNDDGTFTVTDNDLEKHSSKTILIASGLGFKPSGIKNEKALISKGISFCVICDGAFFKNKKVAVIGAEDFAGEEALMLSAFTPDVAVLSHGKDFKFGEKINGKLIENKVTLKRTEKIKEFEGAGKLEGIIYADGAKEKYNGVFIALGTAGAADFANQLGIEKDGNYLVANPKTGKTNVPGVYAAGDCTGGNAQANKSAGEGCNAAISIIKLLRGSAVYVDYC